MTPKGIFIHNFPPETLSHSSPYFNDPIFADYCTQIWFNNIPYLI